ncbi:hypothetical protein DOY81_010603, partial [Sarcophaga bullata]
DEYDYNDDVDDDDDDDDDVLVHASVNQFTYSINWCTDLHHNINVSHLSTINHIIQHFEDIAMIHKGSTGNLLSFKLQMKSLVGITKSIAAI